MLYSLTLLHLTAAQPFVLHFVLFGREGEGECAPVPYIEVFVRLFFFSSSSFF